MPAKTSKIKTARVLFDLEYSRVAR